MLSKTSFQILNTISHNLICIGYELFQLTNGVIAVILHSVRHYNQ